MTRRHIDCLQCEAMAGRAAEAKIRAERAEKALAERDRRIADLESTIGRIYKVDTENRRLAADNERLRERVKELEREREGALAKVPFAATDLVELVEGFLGRETEAAIHHQEHHDREDRLRETLEAIASPDDTDGFGWWTKLARRALAKTEL